MIIVVLKVEGSEYSGKAESRRRPILLLVMPVAVATAVAWIDSRPTWDDAGVTAMLLIFTAAGGSLGGLSWRLASVLVGGPIVLWEIWHGPGVLIVVPVVVAGAIAGMVVRRWTRLV
ncbi:MAG TPA: hypothetical protein VLY03_03850 [Bacteroidota bacterium]|nr:hypothetical protein [Bacteroidota bacterium]